MFSDCRLPAVISPDMVTHHFMNDTVFIRTYLDVNSRCMRYTSMETCLRNQYEVQGMEAERVRSYLAEGAAEGMFQNTSPQNNGVCRACVTWLVWAAVVLVCGMSSN